jgi:serine/threonine protein kinase
VVSGDDPGADDGFVVSFAAGSRIAGYRLEERIGQGGMAVVFRARDERLGRLVALKILAPELAGDAEFQRRFIRESRAAAAIDDPHIVPVFAAGEADGMLFIAMRYVPGGDAHSLLNREGTLPPDRVAAIISPVASALDAAHRAGLVHRDVKPSNMLMDVLPGRPDHVYLSDFGLSKALASTSGMTRAGTVMGTLDYMSPEQIAGKPVDGRADQYALACSAFELLAGAPPFRRDEPTAAMYAHLSESPPQLASLRAGLPPAVDGVLSRALAKAPGDRYASCGQFADALRHAFGFQPYDSGPRVMPTATHPPTETARPAVQADAQHGGRTADWPATLSPVPGTGDAPATETSIPAAPDAITAPGQLPVGSGSGQPQPPRRPRRRIVVAAFLAVIIVAAAGLAAGLLPGSPAKTTAVPISVKSALPAVSGDVYVVYLGGKQANAEIYGEISKAANGEVAQLYAQQFPYQNAPTQAGSVILHPAGTTARFEFQVTPALATRYRVELFQSSTASTPLAKSGIATIYVVLGGTTGNTQTCSRPVCRESIQTTNLVPPSALQTEMSKPWYPYFGINLAPAKEPPPPQWLLLGTGNGHVTASRRISADEFSETVTFSFRIGNDAYDWDWTTCVEDTEAEDGIGLPGHHGCGDERVLASASYLG